MGWQDDPIISETPAPPIQPGSPPAPDGSAPAWAGDPVVSEPAAPPTIPEPSMGQVAMNAIPKGLANLFNTPITLGHLIMQGLASLPMAGHFQGLQDAANEPELKANAPMDLAKQVGLVDPAKEPQTGPQRIVDTAIQTAIAAAAVPAGGVAQAAKGAAVGLASGAAAQTTKELTGSDLLAVAVGVGTPFAINALSAAKTTRLTPEGKLTLKDAQEAGYVVEPSAVRQPTGKLETIAGKASIAQEATVRNQQITNNMAAKHLGLPEDTPLSPALLDALKKKVEQPYQEVEALRANLTNQRSPIQRIDPVKVDQLDWAMQTMRQNGDPPTGSIQISKTDLRPSGSSQLGEKFLLVGSQPVAKADVRLSNGDIVLSKIETLPTAMRKGYAKQLVDDIFDEFGVSSIKTTARSDAGEAFIASSYDVKGSSVFKKPAPNDLPWFPRYHSANLGEELKQARADTTALYKAYYANPNPGVLKAAKESSALAQSLEDDIDMIAKAAGKPELLTQLQAARQYRARIADVEMALNVADGNVSAPVIGRMLDKGRPISGDLKIVGKFAQAFPRVAREAAGVPPAGVSGTDAAMSAVLATGGAAAAGGVEGAATGLLPLLRQPARSRVLSKGYQSKLLEPPKPGPSTGTTAARAGMIGQAVAATNRAPEP